MVSWFNQVDVTYRGDLRELNELNFARFDAKLERRLAESNAKLERRLVQSEAKLEQRFAQLEAKLEAQSRMLTRWMFGFWVTTLVTLGGLMIALDR